MSSPSTSQPFRFSADDFGVNPAGFRPSQTADDSDTGLLRETRKELRRLVADIASLCHSRIDEKHFWPKFLNLVGTAIAAEAGVAWQRETNRWRPLTHCGPLDERLLEQHRAPCHANMLAEVGDAAGPVAVPPGADWDSDEPGNPTHWLATLVPVPVDPDEPVRWLIEIFLPAGGGPATQRGYLRFLAQMTDLAAEYMRAQRLRRATWAADFSERASRMLASLLDQTSDPDFEIRLVDAVCQFAAAERVSLVRQTHGRCQVTAVSGVTNIDRYSPIVREIGEVASEVDAVVGLTVAESHPEDASFDDNQNASDAADATDTIQTGHLNLRGVAVLDHRGGWRLVFEDQQPVDPASEEIERWTPLSRQLGGLLEQHELSVNSGLRRLLTRPVTRHPSWLRRSFVPLGIASSILLAGLIPVPLVVQATGHLQPEFTQILYSPRAAVVAEIFVEHGQQVDLGQPIVRLEDNELDQQIEQLQSRLAILSQQWSSLQDEQTRSDARDKKLLANLTLQQRAIDEERRSLTSQLEISMQNQRSLLLHARIAGKIDAWQIQQSLDHRPVDRGQPLLRIIPENRSWIVQAKIPQDRLDLLLDLQAARAERSEAVEAKLVFTAYPDKSVVAKLLEVGPVVSDNQSSPTALASFTVATDLLPLVQAGAPVEIGIPCGHRPLAYVAGLDLIRMTSQAVQLYW